MPTQEQIYNQGNEFISEPELLLLQFWEEGSTVVHYAALNTENITHDGNEYVASSFELTLPDEGAEQGNVNLTIPNVERIAGRTVLSAVNKIQCRMILVDGSDHEVVISDTKNMLVLSSVTADQRSVSGTLIAKADVLLPDPLRGTSASFFPGLWL